MTYTAVVCLLCVRSSAWWRLVVLHTTCRLFCVDACGVHSADTRHGNENKPEMPAAWTKHGTVESIEKKPRLSP